MSVDFTKGISVASGFSLQAKAPLDVRATVETIEDRNSLITMNAAYEGMLVYVVAEGKYYTYTGAPVGGTEDIPDFSACWHSLVGDQAIDTDVVHKAGAETITGVKDFTAVPTINSKAIATEEFAQDKADAAQQAAIDHSDANLQTAKDYSDANLQTAKNYTDDQLKAKVTDQMGVTIQEHHDNLDSLSDLTEEGLTYQKADGKFQAMTISAVDGEATVAVDAVAKTIKVGLPAVGTAGTYFKVTTDNQGRVTAGENPTTVAGFGITDAVTKDTSGNVTITGKLSVTGEAANFTNAPTIGTGDGESAVVTQKELEAARAADKLTFSSAGTVSLTESGNTVTASLKASGVAAGTYAGITVDENGIVTSAQTLTTLAGYGITDKVLHLDSAGVQTVDGGVQFKTLPTVKAGSDAETNVATEAWVGTQIENAKLSVEDTESVLLDITSNKLTANLPVQTGLAAGTYAGITVNDKGIVTSAKKNVILTDANASEAQSMNGRIQVVGVSPSDFTDNDLVTKEYVDDVVEGQHPQKAVVTASIEANLDGVYAAGPDSAHPGVGATLTVGTAIIGGATVEQGDRVLLAAQTNKTYNGVYVVTSIANGNVVLTRAENMDGDPTSEVYRGSTFLVTGGAYQGTVWSLVNKTISFGTTEIEFVQTGAPNAYNAGAGITVAANKIAVVQGETVKVIGGALEVASGNSNNGKFLVAGTDGSAASWRALSISDIKTGILPVANGGTGASTLNANELLVGNGTGTVQSVSNAAGVLIGTATGAPTFGKVDMSNPAHITGVVPLINGGTGVANANSAIITIGDITLTSTAQTNVTLPTTGTLTTLAGSESLTNKTIVAQNAVAASAGGTAVTVKNGNIVGEEYTIDGVATMPELVGFVIDGGTY